VNPQVFKKDDYVYLLKQPTKGKLDKQYTGPYKIIETLENNNIKIAISDGKVKVVHRDKLKIYKIRPSRLSGHKPSPLSYIDISRFHSSSRRSNRPPTSMKGDHAGQSHLGSTPIKMNPLYQVFVILFPFASDLIGYDCGGYGLNITTLSLLDIGDCELAEIETDTMEIYVQLLQLFDYDKTKVRQCKVEIDRTIFYCGMHSLTSIVQNARRVYL